MFKLIPLGLILASTLLVSVVVLVSCEESENGCDKLDSHLVKKLPDELDATKNYEVALKVSALSIAKHKVVKKWKLIHEAVGSLSCSDTLVQEWLSFGDCFFSEQKRLATVMKPQLVQFADVCQEAILTYLRRKQKKYELRVYTSVREPLLEFLSDSFISRYLDSNPDVMSNDLVNNDCCRPDKSTLSAIESLQKIVQQKEGVDEETASRKLRDRATVSKLLDDYVFHTCETYQQMMYFHFYRELKKAEKIAPNLKRMAIDDQSSNEFKYNVFRYQFCLRLRNEEAMKDFKYRVITQLGATFG